MLTELGRWRFTANDAWIDTALDAIDDLIRQLEQVIADGTASGLTGGFTQPVSALRTMAQLLRRLRRSARYSLWRWLMWFLIRRWLLRVQRSFEEAIRDLGELNGIEDLNDILAELNRIDQAIETLPIPNPERSRRILERILELIDRLFRRLDRLGQ